MISIHNCCGNNPLPSMPTKPNPLSNSSNPPVDSHKAGRPAKGLKQVVARLAKPFKGFGSGSNEPAKAPPAVASKQASNKTPSPQMLAQAREQANNSIARTFSRSASDSVFSSPRFSSLDACRLKLLNARQLVLDTEYQLGKLRAQLGSPSTSDQENVLQIRFELLKLEKILDDAKALKTDYSAQLDEAFSSELEKIQNKIASLQSEMASSSGSKQLHLQTLIAQAELDMLNLKIARDRL